MRIERVELRLIELPLVEPFETSFGKETNRKAIIIALKSGGATGWGECVAGSGPWYSYETVKTAWHMLEDFIIPELLGRDLSGPEAVSEKLSRIRGHNMAKACVEMACWDLSAKLKEVSLSKFLGGTKEKIESGISIGIQKSITDLLNLIEWRLAQGYRRIKIKIKPGWDLEVVRQVREKFADIMLMADANSAYTLKDLALFKALDEFNLIMIEQPLDYDDIVDHARLQKEIRTPICLDESIKTTEDARKALELGSCKIINIKPGRVGGFCNAKRIHDLCRTRQIPVWCGGMLETGIGRAHNVALASLDGFTLPNDISASERYYKQDLVEPPFKLNADGTLNVPQGPGIGVEVLPDQLAKATLKRSSFAS